MSSGSDRIPLCIGIIVSEKNRIAAFYTKKELV
jgi:hypothetical protein